MVRAQLAAANTGLPAINDILSAVSDTGLNTVAPGGLMTIFGLNMTKVPGSLGGVAGPEIPRALNGTEVTVGGAGAPIVLMAGDFVVVQVPVETKPGPQEVVVKNANGSGAARSVRVAGAAPAVYFDATAGIVFKVSDMSLLRPNNPAAAGEQIAILATGLGQTTPALETGKTAPPSPFYVTAPVSVTIGGQPSTVAGGGAWPGFLGMYLVVAQVPAGLSAGPQTLSLKMGEASSNTVQIPVR